MDQILNAPAFVIHLEGDKETLNRKDFFTKNISDAGFTDMRIFNGVDGRNKDITDVVIHTFGITKICWEVSKGQLGCMFSHFKVLKYIIDNQISIATIFEDDVHFHPQWLELAPEYFNKTPKDFDVIFIGNSVDNLILGKKIQKINTDPCYCTHAYIVTLEGAKKLLNTCLNWRYDLFQHHAHKVEGLYIIDICIKYMQELINTKKISRTFTWYCWNGTEYPCDSNKLPLKGNNIRNCGLVFQATDELGSIVTRNSNDTPDKAEFYYTIDKITTHIEPPTILPKKFIWNRR
jgi:GR25 family glycosyltransferase involved in LPS biosynthesis